MTEDEVKAASAAEGGDHVTITNRYELGNLEVKKELLGAPEDAAGKEFDVVVTSNTTGKFVKADGTFSDEEQVLKVSKNTTLQINDLPIGSYTVTELDSNREIANYTFDEEKSVEQTTAEVALNQTVEATITNSYLHNTDKATLRVKKA